MKALTLALLFISLFCVNSNAMFSVTVANPTPAPRRPTGHTEQHSKGGRWYFAANGHAIYCYGPVMTLSQANGDLQKVATFCRDGQAVVPLKD
jgi:hypothetical protein